MGMGFLLGVLKLIAEKKRGEFPGGPVGAWVRPLVGELRSPKLCSMARNKIK